MFKSLFTAVLYQPIINLFVGLYGFIPDLGVIILVVTIVIKAILHPLTVKSIRAQKLVSQIQPKIDALKKEFKDDQQKLAAETMRVYKEHKINPLSSCLPVLLQLPILITLYVVLKAVLQSNQFDLLYPFIKNPGTISTITLGFLDLNKPSIILSLLAGLSQFWQTKNMMGKKPVLAESVDPNSMSSMMNKQMLYFMPILTVFITWRLPSGLTLYWVFSNVLAVLQQLYVLRHDAGARTEGVVEGKIVS